MWKFINTDCIENVFFRVSHMYANLMIAMLFYDPKKLHNVITMATPNDVTMT
jgi:hypothetical protein